MEPREIEVGEQSAVGAGPQPGRLRERRAVEGQLLNDAAYRDHLAELGVDRHATAARVERRLEGDVGMRHTGRAPVAEGHAHVALRLSPVERDVCVEREPPGESGLADEPREPREIERFSLGPEPRGDLGAPS